jgi:hypothetical protein
MSGLLSATITASSFGASASAESYVFRYKTTVAQVQPPVVEPEEYGVGNDIQAFYVAPIGYDFSKNIPVATRDVVEWRKDSGSWPDGIGLDAATGRMNGRPTTQEVQKLLYHGYDAQGHRIARAALNFTVFDPVGKGAEISAYSHTGHYFYKEIPVPDGVDVYRWEPVTDLPSGTSMVGNSFQGTPTASGTYGVAFRGFDYMGREVGIAYGELLVEDGPVIDFIADQTIDPTKFQQFAVNPVVSHSVGSIRYKLVAETPRPEGLTFNKISGRITGAYPGFDVSSTFHLVATDTGDGVEGQPSNSFTLKTKPSPVGLQALSMLYGNVNQPFTKGVLSIGVLPGAKWNLVEGSWPDGVAMDEDTGLIHGKPTRMGTAEGLVIEVSGAGMTTQRSGVFSFQIYPEALTFSTKPLALRTNTPFATAGATVLTGKVEPYTFTAQNLHDGFDFDPTTGVIRSQAGEAAAGSYGTVLSLTNGDGQASSLVIQALDVFNPLSISYAAPEAKRLKAFQMSPILAEDSVIGTPKFEVTKGVRPTWMQFSQTTGMFYGTPTAFGSAGTYGPFEVTLTDASGEQAKSGEFSILVGERDPLDAVVVNDKAEAFVQNQRKTVTAENAYNAPSIRLVQGSLGLDATSTLKITQDGYLVGQTKDPVGTVYSGLVAEVTDIDGIPVVSQPFTITVAEPEGLKPLTGSLDKVFTWTKGVALNGLVLPALANSFGNAAYSFTSAADGLVVDGLHGDVSGTIQQSGTTVYEYQVDDETSRAPAKGRLTLVMLDPMTVEYSAAAEGNVGSAFSFVPKITNAIGKVTYGTLSGTLPRGLTYANGVIGGKPVAAGVSGPLSFTVEDTAGNVETVRFSISIGARLPFEFTYSSATYLVGTKVELWPTYKSLPLGAVIATIEDPSKAPEGISIATAAGWTTYLYGYPTKPGRYVFAVRGVDHGLDATSAADDATWRTDVTLTVLPNDALSLSYGTVRVRVGSAFTGKVPAIANTVGKLSFEPAGASALPAEVVLSPTNGALSGRFQSVGTYGPFDIKVTDEADRTATAPLTMQAVAGPQIVGPASQLDFKRYKEKMSAAPAASNMVGAPAYRLDAASAALPEGLTVDPQTGAVKGTAQVFGTFPGIIVTATDPEDGLEASTDPFTVVVADRDPLAATVPSTFVIPQYFDASVDLNVSNAIGDASYSITPPLPAWLKAAFDEKTGVLTISGRSDEKVAAASYSIAFSDEHDTTATKAISISVGDRLPLAIHPTSAGQYVVPGLYDYDLQQPLLADNGLGTLTWRFISGTLPQGLTFDEASAAFTGHPTAFGTFGGIKVAVADERGGSAEATFSISIAQDGPPIEVTVGAPVKAHLGGQVRIPGPIVGNVIGDPTFTQNGLSGSGLALDAKTGVISGTATAAGDFPATIVVTDVTKRVNPTPAIQGVTILPALTVSATGAIGIVYNREPSPPVLPGVANAATPVTWVLESGTLPAGVTVNPATGALTGRAKALGDFGPVRIRATDSIGGIGGTAVTGPISIHVEMNSDPIDLTVRDYSTYQGREIRTEAPVFDNTLGKATFFSADLAALGLAINADTGDITGVIDQLTDVYVNVSIKDTGTLRVTSKPLHLQIVPTLRVAYPAVVNATQGAALSQDASVSFNIGTVSYEKGSGNWPEGMSVDAATGRIHSDEVVAAATTHPGMTVRATVTFNGDATDTRESNVFSFKVLPVEAAPLISDIAGNRMVHGKVGTAGTAFTPTVVDDMKGRPWKFAGTTYRLNHDIAADTGLSFDPATGTISGTPTRAVIYRDLTITVVSEQGEEDATAPFWFGVVPKDDISARPIRTVAVRAGSSFTSDAPVFDNAMGNLSYANVTTVGGWPVNASTGVVTGTPETAHVANDPWLTKVTVTDEFGRKGAIDVPVRVLAKLTIIGFEYGTATDFAFTTPVPAVTGLGGTASYTFNGLVAGLSGSPTAGTVSGPLLSSANPPSVVPVTVTVKDSLDNATASAVVTIKTQACIAPVASNAATARSLWTLVFRGNAGGNLNNGGGNAGNIRVNEIRMYDADGNCFYPTNGVYTYYNSMNTQAVYDNDISTVLTDAVGSGAVFQFGVPVDIKSFSIQLTGDSTRDLKTTFLCKSNASGWATNGFFSECATARTILPNATPGQSFSYPVPTTWGPLSGVN